jgi:hypothetical protein
MSEHENKSKYLDAQQVVFLPRWAKYVLIAVLSVLAVCSAVTALMFLYARQDLKDTVVPLMSISQTAAGAFAIVVFALFAERQMSTKRLHLTTDQFLEIHLKEALSRIELPQVRKGETVKVNVVQRQETVHGGRKDIYGANYDIHLDNFKMRMWVGINVKRLSVIYFAKANSAADVASFQEIFKFTFNGAEEVGYHTNFEFASIDGNPFVSIWSTAVADQAILGNPSEQLFWVQDIAMMTQSVARTSVRHNINLYTPIEPGPL